MTPDGSNSAFRKESSAKSWCVVPKTTYGETSSYEQESTTQTKRLAGSAIHSLVGRVVTAMGQIALIVPLHEALDHIEITLRQKARFDPRVDARTFSISASDYAIFVLLAPFVRAVASEAPNVTIHLLPRSRDAARLL
jgi:hypothetical protein